MTAKSPIADLSYRNYDGPLTSTDMRWWVIAKTTIRSALKKRSIWVAMSFSAWYYVAMIFVLYFTDQLSQQARPGQAKVNYAASLIWKDQFLHGFSYGQIMYLVVALIVGAGAIANDNRSNALLVYLSKPCTKLDYILGKWLGVFLVLFGIMAIPALFFYGYCGLSYRNEGFFFDDYWLILQILVVLALSAAVYSSLIICFSSLFNKGRLAGATFAGLFFVTNFFSVMMYGLFIFNSNPGTGPTPRHPHRHVHEVSEMARTITGGFSYASIDGLNIGMAKAVFHTDGSVPFGLPAQGQQFVPMPSLPLMLFIVAAVIALALSIAWSRIRAVEVVG